MNAYGFAGGDPVTYSDPFGLCPQEQNGEVCIDFFIQAKSVLGLRGDGRSFSASAPASASRVQILVDPAHGKATWTTSPSCIAAINLCHSPRADNSVKLTRGDDGSLTVGFSLKNSIDPTGKSPSIHGSITLTPDGHGGFTSHGSMTAFPSNAIYQGVNGSWQEIHRHTETTPFDLIKGHGTDTW